jgi:hypothetical protein
MVVKPTAYDRVAIVPVDVASGVAGSYETADDGGKITKVPREKSKHRVSARRQKQFVDVVVLHAVDDRVNLIVTDIGSRIAGGIRSFSGGGKILYPPSHASIGKPQFVDMVVNPTVYDSVDVVRTDVASGATGSADGRSGEASKTTELPLRRSQGKEQFIDVVIKPAI